MFNCGSDRPTAAYPGGSTQPIRTERVTVASSAMPAYELVSHLQYVLDYLFISAIGPPLVPQFIPRAFLEFKLVPSSEISSTPISMRSSRLTLSVLAFIGQVVSAASVTTDDDTPRQCFYYTGANTNSATCNEVPDLICTGGCRRGSYVTAEGCRPNDGSPKSAAAPLTPQNCTVGFGRDTAAAKACLTETKGYSCNGKTSGFALCYGCVKTRTTYHVPSPPEDYPPSWLNQSLTNPIPGSGR
ncbi:hypothetical protein PTTG_26177 [Puccinia triticina 1-1 BBBD Race 1]|uniref:Uncharacterized protein n=2 Tax=Puccinia triticina TaxID=208348 RepID=A0A180GY04_PUCT1|nr:hypothetical protein PTTG_26177 [Puccinia triticina 1-1 BBBD Race 1]